MMRSVAAFPPVFRLLMALFLAAVLGGCGLLSDNKDETAGWSATKLYDAAREAQSDGAWDKAAKYYEKLEARYPYGRYAQQAQLELGYVYWKAGEAGSALAACDRFIKLHPNHPAVDYAYYLKGLINFNDDLGLFGGCGRSVVLRDSGSGEGGGETRGDEETHTSCSLKLFQGRNAALRKWMHGAAAGRGFRP